MIRVSNHIFMTYLHYNAKSFWHMSNCRVKIMHLDLKPKFRKKISLISCKSLIPYHN